MKTRHDGDCTIYAAMQNGRPWDGICTCGHGWEEFRKGNSSEMMSEEREVFWGTEDHREVVEAV